MFYDGTDEVENFSHEESDEGVHDRGNMYGGFGNSSRMEIEDLEA